MRKFLILMVLILALIAVTACGEQDTDVVGTTVEDKIDTTSVDLTTKDTSADETTREEYSETVTEKTTSGDTTEASPDDVEDVRVDTKAMWLSQYDMSVLFGEDTQRDAQEFRALVEKMLDNCLSIGINTVIVQVRPYADSFYPSEIFPPSAFVTGEYGREFVYDAFEIILEESRARGLSVHAWINPMRAMLASEIELIDEKYQLKKWWTNSELREKYLPTVNDRVYLNVGCEEVRNLIVEGAKEILRLYKVDGLHLDDYFYPTTDSSFDSSAYGEYEGGLTLEEWRRENLDLLVKALYDATKEEGNGTLFGISPAGDVGKNYSKLYANVYKWCEETGYVDYICPQIYFGMEHESLAFCDVADRWSEITKNGRVTLLFGMSIEKAKNASLGIEDAWAGSGSREWINNKDVLRKCLEYTQNIDNCSGVAYFSYSCCWDPMSGEELLETKEEVSNFSALLKNIKWN